MSRRLRGARRVASLSAMGRRLEGRVAVVTGASSGIGRATALALAREGVRVALAARSAHALRDAAAACERAGARAIAVETDVSDEEAVEALARRAEEALGPIDLWVNDAAVLAMGAFEDTPGEVFERLLATNVLGTVHGCRAALRRFRARGRGVLVNVASIDGRIATPYAAAYTASKHAVVGLSASLRQELRLAGARGVHVCTVLPATIDTPLFQHAANFTRARVRALPPVYPPEKVARAIVRLAVRPRREALVGASAHVLSASWRVAPALAERAVARAVRRLHLAHDRGTADSPGNAFAPAVPEAVRGGWLTRRRWWSRRVAAIALPAVAALVVARLRA